MDSQEAIELIEYEIAVLVRRATFTNRKYGGIDRSAYLLLHQLSEHGQVGVKTLADEFRLDISTVSRQTAALEAKGYAQRLPDPLDRRASTLRITEFGLQQLKQARTQRQARFAELMQDWPLEDRQKFGELLSRLNHTILDS